MAIHRFTNLIDQGREVPIYGDGTTKRDYTDITDIIDGILQIAYLPPQRGEVPITSADITKARTMLGYAPQVKIEEGIRRFVAWYRHARAVSGVRA